MGFLRDAEVRRLLRHLCQRIEDNELLARYEDELRGEFAEEFLREPDLLVHFPQLSDEFIIAGVEWKLRVIPHGHLRIVQRGIRFAEISSLFVRFVEEYIASGQLIAVGHYSIVGKPKPSAATITVRADVDVVTDASGQCHVVTVYLGRSNSEDMKWLSSGIQS